MVTGKIHLLVHLNLRGRIREIFAMFIWSNTEFVYSHGKR
jgi:hypothetical protein